MIKFNISKEFEDKNLTHVSIGYKVAESVINHPLFGAEILKFNSFTYTKDTPNDVYLRWIYLIEASKIEIDVEPYFYKNQNVIGMTQNNKISLKPFRSRLISSSISIQVRFNLSLIFCNSI
jgi:hypothetical protein